MLAKMLAQKRAATPTAQWQPFEIAMKPIGHREVCAFSFYVRQFPVSCLKMRT
jgi:hypothetical protein